MWMVQTALLPDAPWDHVVVVCHNISIGQPALKNGFRGKIDFVSGLPETHEDEDALMNLLETNRNEQKLVILDDMCSKNR